MISRFVIILTTSTILFILWKGLNLSYILSSVITIAIVLLGYIIIAIIRHRKRLKLLEVHLDPEAFIEATERQKKITGKNKRTNTYLNFDIVAGLMSLGKYKEAMDVMEELNLKYLTPKNGLLLGYYHNKMILLYELGQKEKADELFENKIKDFPLKTPVLRSLMGLLLAIRAFQEGEFEESKELCNKYLNNNKSRRLELELLYILAEIDEKQGNIESAIEKYTRIAKEGNKLNTATKAREKLNI